MTTLITAFLVSLIVSIIATPFTIWLAKKYKWVDDPKKRPHPAHIQNRVIPRAGGLPIYIAIITGLLIFIPLNKAIIGIIIAITLLLIVGLLDDKFSDFSPFPRLGFQILAALTVVLAGIGITFITNPFGGILYLDAINIPIYFFGEHHILLIADLLALIWITWIMNVVNWSKGVDGQMPGVMTIAFLVIGFISYRFFIQGDPNQFNIALIAFIVAGAALGLLYFNWHPAKILPAFSGSTILGFMLATVAILSGGKLATAIIVLLVPAIDFFYTFFRRIVSGKSPFFGDQKHLHHLLLQRGWSHQKISLFFMGCSTILGILVINLSSKEKLFTLLLGTVIITGAIVWLQLFYFPEGKNKK
jgi:UDP-GlcNAc:undecaprenyl-phosphate GlcNAc-1-phosphate transferase